jgi:hypothetical protein
MDLLSIRPSSVVQRLEPRSGACPLNLTDVLDALPERSGALPVFRAPLPAVVRAALLAAKELGSAVGLMLPAGSPAHPWFAAVCRAADELAARHPIFLCGEVVVRATGEEWVARAADEAFRLVDAGITHLAVDAAAVAPNNRGAVTARVATAATERELSLEMVLPPYGGIPAASRAASLVEAMRSQGCRPRVASIRCPAPTSDDDADAQLGRLTEIAAGLPGIAVMRRGATSAPLLERMAGAPLRLCEDGGSVFGVVYQALSEELRHTIDARAAEARVRPDPLEWAAATLGQELDREPADRAESLAYVEASAFIESLGARGSAAAVARGVAQRT